MYHTVTSFQLYSYTTKFISKNWSAITYLKILHHICYVHVVDYCYTLSAVLLMEKYVYRIVL